jgi:hypothetical protein
MLTVSVAQAKAGKALFWRISALSALIQTMLPDVGLNRSDLQSRSGFSAANCGRGNVDWRILQQQDLTCVVLT